MPEPWRPCRRHLLACFGAFTLTACGSSVSPPGAAGDPAAQSTVIVFAAASLAEVFGDIGQRFETTHPPARVTLNLGASSALAQQIVSGAPADVFAAAAPAAMATVTSAGASAAPPQVFARNRLTIVVPAGNPGNVRGLSDFARRELTIALCEAQVPCGAASRTALATAGVTPLPDTLEQDVKAVLSKVRLGEVDAGLVYRTDVLSASSTVTAIGFPEADRAVNDYLIAPLASARNPTAAAAFVDYILSEEGQRALAAAGFQSS